MVLGRATSQSSLLVEPDDGVKPIVKALDHAQHTIFVSAYILSNKLIIRALDRAAAQGVGVYVLLDQYPFGLYGQPAHVLSLLQAAGIQARWSPGYFVYCHAKFMILDDKTLILSTANFSLAGFTSDRDFVLFDQNAHDVREADNIFRADWDGISPVINDHNLIVSPVNSRAMLGQLMARATRSIDLYSEEVLDGGMVRDLAAASKRGVRVRVLAARVSSAARRTLNVAGAQVREGVRAGRPYVHAKVILVDGRSGFVGSENLSATSLDQNRELGLLIKYLPAIRRMESTFRKDWAAG